ncbi:hypothetical protein AAMO2058_001656400 [Amorphochlora amoebiformis]
MDGSPQNSTHLNRLAHNLRTPLVSIQQALRICLNSNQLPPNLREVIESANTAAEFMSQACLLMLSKSGKLEPTFSFTRVSLLVGKLRSILSALDSSTAVVIEYQFKKDRKDYKFLTDPTWVLEIATNFLTNACKFTQEGYIKAVFTLDHEKDKSGTVLKFSVHDTGPGVPEEKRESIFQPYVRINQSTFGSGLGLYDCKLKTERLKGKIFVERNPHHETGSIFGIEIPVRRESYPTLSSPPSPTLPSTPPSALSASPSRPPPPPSSPKRVRERTMREKSKRERDVETKTLRERREKRRRMRNCRVLIAEDNTLQLKLMLHQMEKLEWKVTVASDGEEAVRLCTKERFQMLITDIGLPKLDGFQVSTRLRENQVQTYIVGMSASQTRYTSEKIQRAGMNEFQLKPLKQETLRQCLVRANNYNTPNI